jgi:hypothetical protein
LAEFWYNTSSHAALGRSPFEVLYGFPPRHLSVDLDSVAPIPELHKWLEDRELMHSLIKQHLSRAQERMKRQADKGRSERSFSVGDKVYLKLQPYVQSSLARRANNKLAFRFFGPFTVCQKLGPVAYKLDLPPATLIHPVFHVSQLKATVGSHQVSPLFSSEFQGLQVPFKILQRRWSTGSHPTEQVLVQWSHLPIELATWEPLVQLQQQFPRAPVWGQPGSKEGGIVSSQTQPEDGGASEAQSQSAPRKTRNRRPNPNYVGPVWQN